MEMDAISLLLGFSYYKAAVDILTDTCLCIGSGISVVWIPGMGLL